MSNDITKSKDTLRGKAAETRSNVSEMAHLAKDSAQDKLGELKDKAVETYEDGKEKMHEIEENIARRVREAPMKSVLIAAGAGLALGFLWRRG